MKEVAFFAGAIGALGGAIAVIALRNAFYSVLALIVHLISLAGLFLLLQGEFIAAAASVAKPLPVKSGCSVQPISPVALSVLLIVK